MLHAPLPAPVLFMICMLMPAHAGDRLLLWHKSTRITRDLAERQAPVPRTLSQAARHIQAAGKKKALQQLVQQKVRLAKKCAGAVERCSNQSHLDSYFVLSSQISIIRRYWRLGHIYVLALVSQLIKMCDMFFLASSLYRMAPNRGCRLGTIISELLIYGVTRSFARPSAPRQGKRCACPVFPNSRGTGRAKLPQVSAG